MVDGDLRHQDAPFDNEDCDHDWLPFVHDLASGFGKPSTRRHEAWTVSLVKKVRYHKLKIGDRVGLLICRSYAPRYWAASAGT